MISGTRLGFLSKNGRPQDLEFVKIGGADGFLRPKFSTLWVGTGPTGDSPGLRPISN